MSSKPKGYSYIILEKILHLRLKNINGQNIKNYFNSIEVRNISITHLNFDTLDRYKQFTSYYKDKLFTPNIIKFI